MSNPLTVELVQLIRTNKMASKHACFRYYTDLTPEVAAELAKITTGYIELDGLTELTDEVAQALSLFSGELSLDGLANISPNAIRSLSRACTKLELNGLKRLSREQARALLDCPGEVSLCGLEVIDDTAEHHQLLERLLSEEHSELVCTYKLRDISNDVLRMLARRLRYLNLELADVTVEQANILVEHEGALHLIGLHTLEPEIARILVRHNGPLELYGGGEECWMQSVPLATWVELSRFEHHLRIQVRSISDEAARLLAENFRGTISLESLVDVSDEALFFLSRLHGHKRSFRRIEDSDGEPCHLSQLPSLGLEVWEDTPGQLHYMKEICDRLSVASMATALDLPETTVAEMVSERFDLQIQLTPEFSYLKSISPGIAKILSRHPGGVIIDRLEELTLDVAQALAGNKKGIRIRSLGSLDSETAAFLTTATGIYGTIDSLGDIPEGDAYVRLFRNYIHQRIAANSYISLETASLHVSLAEELLKIETPHPTLFLNNLTKLCYDCAAILARWKGGISFGNPEMCDDTARLLSTFQAESLSLDWPDLSAFRAAALARYPGKLWLGVKELSDEAAEQLSGHRNELDMTKLETLSCLGVEHLSKHRPRTSLKSVLSRHPELCTCRVFRSR